MNEFMQENKTILAGSYSIKYTWRPYMSNAFDHVWFCPEYVYVFIYYYNLHLISLPK